MVGKKEVGVTKKQLIDALNKIKGDGEIYFRDKVNPDYFERVVAVTVRKCYKDFQHGVPTRTTPFKWPPITKKDRIEIIELRVDE